MLHMTQEPLQLLKAHLSLLASMNIGIIACSASCTAKYIATSSSLYQHAGLRGGGEAWQHLLACIATQWPAGIL